VGNDKKSGTAIRRQTNRRNKKKKGGDWKWGELGKITKTQHGYQEKSQEKKNREGGKEKEIRCGTLGGPVKGYKTVNKGAITMDGDSEVLDCQGGET